MRAHGGATFALPAAGTPTTQMHCARRAIDPAALRQDAKTVTTRSLTHFH